LEKETGEAIQQTSHGHKAGKIEKVYVHPRGGRRRVLKGEEEQNRPIRLGQNG